MDKLVGGYCLLPALVDARRGLAIDVALKVLRISILTALSRFYMPEVAPANLMLKEVSVSERSY